MTRPTLPPLDSVTGGSHGVTAGYDAMLALAARYDAVGSELTDRAGLGARVMGNGDLLESAVLAPVTFAEAERKVLGATAGVEGLALGALDLEADAVLVRATVDAFRASDRLSRSLVEALDHAVGAALVPATIAALPLLTSGGVALLVHWSSLTEDERDELVDRLVGELGEQVHARPGLLQHLVNGGGGLVDALTPGPGLGWLAPEDGGPLGSSTTHDAARLLALLFGDDGLPVVEERRDVPVRAEDLAAPTSVADLMEQLGRTNALDATDEDLKGAIQVQQLGSGDESRYVVYLPGTDDLAPVPAGDEAVRDMLTNYRLIGGMDTTYADGVRGAMRDAGLEGEEVMLVGHSQGGMVAAALAADPEFTAEFDVRHVVTAGSPTAQVPHLPAGVGALHLENRGDVVPLLDGEDNPDQPRRVTVQFDSGIRDVADTHDLRAYRAGAAAVDASAHPSVRDAVDEMRAAGFLDGEKVESVRTWTIQRGAR